MYGLILNSSNTILTYWAWFLLAVPAAMLFGCAPEQSTPKNDQLILGNRPIMPADYTAASKDENSYVLLVRLRMISIEIPVGIVSESEELWSYLDEECIRQGRTPTLNYNGIRIGRGGKETWTDLAEVLRGMTGRKLEEYTAIAIPGKPLSVVLKPSQGAQTIFFFRQDRSLYGVDYPAGDNLLSLVCTFDEDDPSKVLIMGLPQIRTSRQKPKFINQGSGLLLVNRSDVYSMEPLIFRALVDSKDFLIIGPGAQSARRSSVGHHFLVKERQGVEFETVLVIKPEVFATQPRHTTAMVDRP